MSAVLADASSASAPKKAPSIELKLVRPGTQLRIFCVPNQHVTAAIDALARDKKAKSHRLVFAMASFGETSCRREEFRLDLKYTDPTLWLASAAFDLTTDEARRVEETFASHGLEVERKAVAP